MTEFKPFYYKCRIEGRTWEICTEKYCCDEGEECWFMSEDYFNNWGKGGVKKP